MRRLLLVSIAAVMAATPVLSYAQGRPGRGGQDQADQDAAKKKKRDQEWNDRQAPLPQLRNAGPCPYVKSLYDAARYVEFKDNKEASANVAYTGEIQGISAGCAYKGDEPIKMAMQVLFELGKGPQAEGSSKTYRYWVAVTDRNREVLAKQQFEMKIDFPKGQDRIYHREELNNIVIPRAAETTSGANFEVLIGFDVTPQMAEFNRAGKRFRLNVGQQAQADTTKK
ncbi:Tat pathway signal sequence domain protein [Phenylobacterium soli]|uniref:Tat pathway signal sequence domain protein n=1 Tax=Phenylobacterium soli TaxID=2170551 RepID=A0A328AJK1_9CAUL|nr:Tat pathway signal sequence domain protein [Phenylobacterium soli]RAK54246.1 Tat pathway signal sequence domain protein [Phenylobacterium soli]